MHKLHELKEMLCDELEKYGNQELTAGSLEVVDKLAHAIKNINKILEDYEEGEYSGEDGRSYARGGRGRSYENRGGNVSYDRGGSYARGRGRNARRDSMGRYSSDGNMLVEELRDLMEDAPDDRTRMEFQKFIQKMEDVRR